MNAIQQLLTDHIDIWTAAETEKRSGRGRASGSAASVYGIKKLRELILELAVRGKLVPQDSSDEPASELLKRIQIEKAKLIAENQIKKEKSFDPISTEEIPFQLPHEWKWVRIGQIGHDWGQKIPDCDFRYIEVSAIDNQRGVISSAELVRPENAPSRARKLVKNGTLIYSTIRPYLLNIAVVEEDFLPEPIASTAFAVVHPFCAMPPRYFLFFLRSPVFVRYVESVQMGIAYPAINDRQFFSGVMPLPPIEEQHRIIAKVDELMALCDQLEAQHSDAADAHEQLVSHLLGTLTQSQSAADFNTNWQRIAAHFDTLFNTEASIDALKQTLLQLAVMGKLIAQDANDEPASELLEKVSSEIKRLQVEKKYQKTGKLKSKEGIHKYPKTWVTVQIGEICPSIVPSRDKPKSFSGNIPWITLPSFPMNGWYLDSSGAGLGLTQEEATKYSARIIPENSVLMSCIGRFGLTAINRIPVIPNQQIHAFIIVDGIIPEFLSIAIRVSGKQMEEMATSTTIAYLNKSNCESIEFGLPPTAEQRRIVTKVDELMALCDQLRSCIAGANHQQKKLADVLVEHAVMG